MSEKQVKRVLIIGGGVAALSAAAALVEHNQKKTAETKLEFNITIMTSDDILGGRACSWTGGGEPKRRFEKGAPGEALAERWRLRRYDFAYWPPTLPLNHGFHAVFDETTYVNFWYTLRLAGRSRDQLVREGVLISNNYEILVHEAAKENVCRLQICNPNKYPPPFNSHLTDAAIEILRHGGWSLSEIYSFTTVVMKKVFSYLNFDQLSDLDQHSSISFQKWCRDHGVRESIFSKMMFKFLFQGTYIAPNTMDATSALMGLWVILRDKDAAQWYYINGGITERLMDPIAEYLRDGKVTFLMREELMSFIPAENFQTIERITSAPSEVEADGFDRPSDPYDYYVSTLPLDSLVEVLGRSVPNGAGGPGNPTLLDVFPDIQTLRKDKRFVPPAGTVNLQAWFSDRGLLADTRERNGSYKNVIAGLEPLCVIVDYKNILPMYGSDQQFPGSVLEINGSLQELESPENYGYFECRDRFGKPDEKNTIDFAKTIMLDLARRYKFNRLEAAVKNDAFLEMRPDWPGRRRWNNSDKIPPFLWKNTDPYNRFFVTGPGTLQYRPWIWRKEYPLSINVLKKHTGVLPEGYPDNLFIAGDWTRNGFDIPCMEGAARSGRMAAQAIVKKFLGLDATADPRKPDRYEKDERSDDENPMIVESFDGRLIFLDLEPLLTEIKRVLIDTFESDKDSSASALHG